MDIVKLQNGQCVSPLGYTELTTGFSLASFDTEDAFPDKEGLLNGCGRGQCVSGDKKVKRTTIFRSLLPSETCNTVPKKKRSDIKETHSSPRTDVRTDWFRGPAFALRG